MKYLNNLKIPLVFALLALVVCASPSAGAGLEELTVYPFVQYFTWEEFDSGGGRLLKESGPLYGAGTMARVDLYDRSLLLQAKGELFGGKVDYDGQTTGNTPVPVKTTVAYLGTKLESDIGWRVTAKEGGSLEPFLGLGYRWWLRDLYNTGSVQGYTEEWQTLYSRLGMRGGYAVNERARLFAEAGAKYPFLTENRADFPGIGKVLIKPKSAWSAFAEIGARFDRIRVALYYEGFRFSESPLVPISHTEALFQPRSDSDIFGLTIGWCFK